MPSNQSSNTRALSLPGSRPDIDCSSGVWVVRNIAQMVAYTLPSKYAEEWLGDLLEVNNNLIQAGVPRWKINAIALLRIAQLIWVACQITWSDFIDTDWDGRE